VNRTRPTAGRPPAPDPRRIGVFVRLTADELAAIDEARALVKANRSAFARRGALELAERLLKERR